MPRPRLPHLLKETARNGETVWYVRVGHGPRVRIRGAYASAEFMAAYWAALGGNSAPAGRAAAPKPDTLAWLIARYRQSASWSTLALATRRQRENILKHVETKSGAVPYGHIARKHIVQGRDDRRATPAQANNFLKAMRGLFKFAVESDFVSADPTQGVASIPLRPGGFHTWTVEEIVRFEERWPVGTRERLALAILLYTGLRRGDAALLGRQHIKDGLITLRTSKNDAPVYLPVLPELQRIIDASPTGDLALVATADGRPMTKESFGNWFCDACKAAGVPGRAHGLRKAGATKAAEAGATTAQLNAIFGWSGARMASLYTAAADRKRLSRDAIEMLSRENDPATSIPARANSARDSKA